MKIDDKIGEIECLLVPFKNIHPNYITAVGLLSNILIPYYLDNGKINLANIFLVIRYLTDILDGAVARKYKKTSKLGGLLDTICDVMLMGIYTNLITFKLTKNLIFSRTAGIFMSLLHTYYLKSNDSIIEHENIKSDASNNVEKTIQFLTNNTIFVFIGLFFFNLYY